MTERNPVRSLDQKAHCCLIFTDSCLYGCAITECWEADDGTLWADNGEYGSRVNYCPICGYESKNKIEK